jgi:hypothetical protein
MIAKAQQYELPEDRRVNWRAYCGIPGGYPVRTTIAATLDPGATAAQINSAVTSCPSNQVVFLNAGVYNLGGSITLSSKSYKTLRGAGTNRTILNFTSGGITSSQFSWSGAAGLDSGYTKGSTQIVFTATPNAQVTPGNLLLIDALDNTNFVFATSHTSPAQAGTGRNIGFVVRVLTKSGTTVTFEPPLPFDLTGYTPQAFYLNGGPGLQLFGIEDMTITNSGAQFTIQLVQTRQCWLKNVELVKAADMTVQMVDCLQTVITNCVIKDVLNYPGQADGFGAFVDGGSYFLIEDNIFLRTGCHVLLKSGASAGAIMGNFMDEVNFSPPSGLDRQMPDINFGHGAHQLMILAEGNVCAKMQHDAYHGSASHLTIHRNWIHGTNGSSVIVNWKCPIDLLRGTYSNNIIGNILGDLSWTNVNDYIFEAAGTFNFSSNAIYRFGYPNSGNGSLTESGDNAWIDSYPWFDPYPDNKVAATTIRHGNYDYFTHSVINSNGFETTMTNSFFYDGVPPYVVNSLIFNPASPLTAHPTNIQSGHRKWYGTNYIASVGNPDPGFNGGRIIARPIKRNSRIGGGFR